MQPTEALDLSPLELLECERELCSRSLIDFIRLAWPILEPGQPYIHGWHMDAICEHLEAVTAGQITRLLVNVPPGTMKSMASGVFWPAWEWGPKGHGTHRFIGASHEEGLATRDAVRMRRLIQSDWYQERWPTILVGDQNQKCLLRGTQVLMENGTQKAIEQIQPGDSILSVDEATGKTRPDKVLHVWSNGIKPTRKITLKDGSTVTATLNHRFYGWDQWAYVGDMKVGDPLAVLKTTPRQNGGLSNDDAFLLALWLAEGTKSYTGFQFTNVDPLIITRVQEIANARGWALRKVDEVTWCLSSSRAQTGATPNGLLKQHMGAIQTYGTRSKRAAHTVDTIRVPDTVASASDEAVREFIGTYIACDGCVSKVNSANLVVSINSASEMMARDMALLLKRFDVKSAVYRQKTPRRDSWSVVVAAREDIARLEGFSLYSKSQKLAELVQACRAPSRHRGGRNATIPPGWWGEKRPRGFKGGWASRQAVEAAAAKHDMPMVKEKLESDLDWRAIKAIDNAGEQETWHLQTEATGTFIANGFYSHNTYYETLDTGWRQSCPVRAMTGRRGDRVIWDDPHSVEDAHSDKALEEANRVFRETLPTRLNSPERSSIIIIMQRLSVKDVSGVILEQELGYDHLCLPMEWEAPRTPTSIGFVDPRTTKGELLFPERFPREVVDRDKKVMGAYAVAGQLQQRPAPARGGEFEPDLITVVDAIPAGYIQWARGWDLAATEGAGDWTVGAKLGKLPDGRLIIAALVREQFATAKRDLLIRTTASADGMGAVTQSFPQDPGQAGKGQVAALTAMLLGHRVHSSTESGDKALRARPLASQVNAGNVLMLRAPWNKELTDELRLFPNGSNDDQVDALSRAFQVLLEGAKSQGFASGGKRTM